MANDTDREVTKDELKGVVRAIVLSQGNDFIKELLRRHSIKIGSTKREFARNIADAIDNGTLTRERIQAWLDEIEGWGDQHLYLFHPPAVAPADVRNLIEASDRRHLVGKRQGFDFPAKLALSSIHLEDDGISLVWHLRKGGWDRAKAKDYARKIGLDRYRFDAYRERMDRSVVRFEWRFADRHCAILIARSKDIDHVETRTEVWDVVRGLGFCGEPCDRLSLSEAVKSASKLEGTRVARFEVDGGFIELVSTLTDGGIDRVAAVRHARNAVDETEFARAQGMFSVRQGGDGEEAMSVQVFGSEGRMRIWAQCKRDVVHALIGYFVSQNGPHARG